MGQLLTGNNNRKHKLKERLLLKTRINIKNKNKYKKCKKL